MYIISIFSFDRRTETRGDEFRELLASLTITSNYIAQGKGARLADNELHETQFVIDEVELPLHLFELVRLAAACTQWLSSL